MLTLPHVLWRALFLGHFLQFSLAPYLHVATITVGTGHEDRAHRTRACVVIGASTWAITRGLHIFTMWGLGSLGRPELHSLFQEPRHPRHRDQGES